MCRSVQQRLRRRHAAEFRRICLAHNNEARFFESARQRLVSGRAVIELG